LKNPLIFTQLIPFFLYEFFFV
jgi:hypothetical protein